MGKGEQHLVESAIPQWADLREAKKEVAHRFVHKPQAEATSFAMSARGINSVINPSPTENVVGVGIGEKFADGKQTGLFAIKFLVRMKYSKSDLDTKHLLPSEISGLATDVEEVGTFHRLPATAPARARVQAGTMPNPRTKIRPAQPGCSIGFEDPQGRILMAGTFGALVKDKDGLYVLSNNHVLADENRLPIGGAIFEPGLLDKGNPATDQIASLTKFTSLQIQQANKVDCAIAKAIKPSLVSKSILHIGAPTGSEAAAIDMAVHKFGRTTGYTVGQVTSIDTDVKVQYEIGTLTFTGQMIIAGASGQPFSNAGDSGSLILQRGSNKAVGLLFAGSSSHTIANHISDVLKALGVTLA